MDHNRPNSEVLKFLMQRAGLFSYRALSRKAGISNWQIQQLRSGKLSQMRLTPLLQVCQALNITLADLFNAFRLPEPFSTSILTDSCPNQALQLEYQRLQAEHEQQHVILRQTFQREALSILESWLLYWPTAAKAAQDNPQMLAKQLLPLVRPLETLLAQWDVKSIAAVGSEVTFDPHLHQLIEGQAQTGDRVQIRYPGYWHRDALLLRAKVSAIR
jgi:DNA-binding Xre family transcriptional regulator